MVEAEEGEATAVAGAAVAAEGMTVVTTAGLKETAGQHLSKKVKKSMSP